MKRLLAIVLLIVSLCSAVNVYADEPAITPLRQSQKAPYSGVLLNPEAVAKVAVDYNNVKSQIEIEVQKASETEKAKAQKAIDDLRADLQYNKTVSDAMLKSKDKEIDVLLKQVNNLEKYQNNPMLWCGLGLVGGVVITVATVLVIGAAK